MGEIVQNDSHGKGGGKRRSKKHSTRIDMTPMVDLMCLLITFFMLTTAFSKPKVMEITMPQELKPGDPPPPEVPADRAFNILITKDTSAVYWYMGKIDPTDKTIPIPTLEKSNYSKDGIRKILLKKNETVFKQIAELKEKVLTGQLVMADSTLTRKIKQLKKADKKGPIVLIKPAEDSKYRRIIDIIDEMAIVNIANYAVVDMSKEEEKLLEQFKTK